MSESVSEKIPPKLNFRKFIDKIRYGSEEIEFYHSKPISDQRASQLFEKLRRKGLSSKEAGLLSEYERAGLYRLNDNGSGKVLVLASGYDGIPAHVFGEERTIMSSLETRKYFSTYLSFLGRTTGVKKIEADMFNLPMPTGSFDLIVINNMDVFNLAIELFKEARRLTNVGGKFIVTSVKNGFRSLDEETKKQFEQIGWELVSQGSSPVLGHHVFKAVESDK